MSKIFSIDVSEEIIAAYVKELSFDETVFFMGKILSLLSDKNESIHRNCTPFKDPRLAKERLISLAKDILDFSMYKVR